MSGQLETKIKVQSDDGAPDCLEAEDRLATGRERGDRATTGWMVVPFDAMGKSVGKRSGVGWGGNDQGFGVYDAFKMSKC